MNKKILLEENPKVTSIIKLINPKIISKKLDYEGEHMSKYNDKFYFEYSNLTKIQILENSSDHFKNIVVKRTNFEDKRIENKGNSSELSSNDYKYNISYNFIPNKIVFPVSLNRIGEFKLGSINVLGVIVEISELEKRKVGLDEIDLKKIIIIDGSVDHNHDIIKMELCLWRDKALLNLELNDIIIAENIKVSTFKGNFYLSQHFDTILHLIKKDEMNRIISIVRNKNFNDNFKNLSFSDLKLVTEMIVNCMKNKKLNDPFEFSYNLLNKNKIN